MLIIPTTGFPFQSRPYNNITPFTYRDGLTYLQVLEGLRSWLHDVLVPHLDSEMSAFTDDTAAQIVALMDAVDLALISQAENVNLALAAQSEANATEVQEAITAVELIASTITGQNTEQLNAINLALSEQLTSVTSALNSQTAAVELDLVEALTEVDNAVQQIVNSAIEVSDPVMVAVLNDENSEFTQALKGMVASNTDPLERVFSALDMRKPREVNICLASDSTGDGDNDWFARAWKTKLAELWFERPARYKAWAQVGAAYPNWVNWQTGTVPANPGYSGISTPDSILGSDAFSRTQADLNLSTPENGSGVWIGSAGIFKVVGTHVVLVSEASTGGAKFKLIDRENEKFNIVAHAGLSFNYGASSETSIGFERDGSADRLEITISGTSTVALHIRTRIAGVIATVATFPVGTIATNSWVAHNVKIHLSGTTVTGTVDGTVVTATLTPETVALFTGAGSFFFATTNKKFTLDNVMVNGTIVTGAIPATPEVPASVPTVNIYNGSVPGYDVQIQRDNLVAMYPTAPDVMFISHGHNTASNVSRETFMAKIQTFVDELDALYPETPVVLVSQNPRFSPATGIVEHAEKQAYVREYAKNQGWGYVSIFEAYAKLYDSGKSLILTDGVNPTSSSDWSIETGAKVAADEASKWVNSHTARAGVESYSSSADYIISGGGSATPAAISVDGFARNTVVLFGTSLEALNGNGSEVLDPILTDDLSGRGWFNWANAYLGNSLRLVKAAGIGGNTTTQMLARIDTDVLAFDSDWVFIGGPTNDTSTGGSTALVTGNISAILDKLKDRRVLLLTGPPNAGHTTIEERKVLFEVNAWIRKLPQTRKNVMVVDVWSLLAAQDSIAPATGMAVDTVHYSVQGAERIGRSAAATLKPFITPAPPRRSNSLDPTSVCSNPNFSNGGNGWAVIGSGLTVAYTLDDDTFTNKAVMTFSGATSTGNLGIEHTEDIVAGKFAAGDVIQCSARIRWDNAVPLNVAASFRPFVRIALRQVDGAFANGETVWGWVPGSQVVVPAGCPVKGDTVVVTTKITIPATASPINRLALRVGFVGMASGTVTASDVTSCRV